MIYGIIFVNYVKFKSYSGFIVIFVLNGLPLSGKFEL